MRAARALSVLILVMDSRSVAAQAETLEDAAARSVSGSLASAATGGLWAGNGRCRILVIDTQSKENIYSRTYAQWLAGNADGSLQIRKSIPIGELTDQPLFVVRNVRSVDPTTKSKCEFEAEVTNRYSDKSATVRVRMGQPGEMSVEMPRNEEAE